MLKNGLRVAFLHLLFFVVLGFGWLVLSASHATALPQVDKAVHQELILQNIPGALVAIVQNNKVIYSQAYGHEDLERTTPMAVGRSVNWASISKTVTAVSAMQTLEALKSTKVPGLSTPFTLHTPIYHYLPETTWPRANSKDLITFHHLLSNRSGIRQYNTNEAYCLNNASVPDYDKKKHPHTFYNAINAVAVFKDKPLCTSPGSREQYTTFGFSLLAAVIEAARGKPYTTLVLDEIAKPAKITTLRQASKEQHGFNKSCGALAAQTEKSKTFVLPGGGWRGSITDLARFANGLLHNSYFPNTQRLWTNNANFSNKEYQYGIEHRLWGSTNQEAIGHGGTHDHARMQFLIFPSHPKKLAVAVYANHGFHNSTNIKRLAMVVANAMGTTLELSNLTETCTQSCDGRFSAVWRQTNQPVVKRLGLTTKAFGAERTYLNKHGYILSDIEAYTDNGTLKWDGVFKKSKQLTALWRNFSREDFGTKRDEMLKDGYVLVDVETYETQGKRLWAGLFYKRSGKSALFRYMDHDAFGKKHAALAKQGFKLIDVEPFKDGFSLKWAGVWVGGAGSLLNRNFSSADFGTLRRQRDKAGWKLVDIERYPSGDKTLWAGVWEKTPAAERLNRGHDFCGTWANGAWSRHGITNRHEQWQGAGFELIDWERD